jgi:hypothetical protein
VAFCYCGQFPYSVNNTALYNAALRNKFLNSQVSVQGFTKQTDIFNMFVNMSGKRGVLVAFLFKTINTELVECFAV